MAKYVEAAAEYCSLSDISITRVEANDPITASAFNSLDSGIGKLKNSDKVGQKTANIDLIKAADINALASNYNAANILGNLPENDDGAENKCCQIGMSCMTKAEGRPSLQDCLLGQTPKCIRYQS